jgi:hypothetical protein
MKRAYTFIVVLVLLSTCINVSAQEIDSKLTEAEKAYQDNKLEDARFALQGALTAINQAVGQEILLLLPENIGEMPVDQSQDHVTGLNGIAGVSVTRTYEKDTTMNARIDILGDSPLLAGLNALLSMPVLASSDPNQKKVKVGGYKGLLNRENSEEGLAAWSLQVPINQTLVTLSVKGVSEEKKILEYAGLIPFEKIAALTN